MTTENDKGPDQPDQSDAELSIADELKAGREAAGYSAEQIAHAMHLDASVITALEGGDFASLGAPIFVKGYLRSYARLVNIDASDIISAYEQEVRAAPPELPTDAHYGIRMDEASGRGGRIAWVILALIVIGVGVWLYQSDRFASLMNTTESAQGSHVVQPATLSQAEPTKNLFKALKTSQPEEQHKIVVGQPSDTTHSNKAPREKASSESKVAASEAMTETATSSPVTDAQNNEVNEQASSVGVAGHNAAETETASGEPDNSRQTPVKGLAITLYMAGSSWVEVDAANGERLYYGLAQEGSTLKLTGQPPLNVFLGNAPAVRLLAADTVIHTTRFTRDDNTAHFVLYKPNNEPAYAGKATTP